MSSEAEPAREERLQFVFDQDPETSVDRDGWQPRVTSLLQPFDEERAKAFRRQHVRIEVIALDALRLRENNLAEDERRKLGPETPHHFGTRHREEQIDRWPRRNRRLERALQPHCPAGD